MRLVALLLLALLGAGRASASDPPVLHFVRMIVDTGGERARACLRFDQALDPRVEAHYGDYLALSPAVTPAVETQGKDLCLSGLAFGRSYALTVRKGLRSADGHLLVADETRQLTLGDRNPLISISGNGFILPRDGANGLTIDTVNIDRLRIHVLRMSDRMLAQHPETLTNAGQEIIAPQVNSMLAGQANLVWSGTMDIRRDPNRTVQTAFPVTAAREPGAYLVVAENAARAPATDFDPATDSRPEDWSKSLAAHWLIRTDVALTTLSGADALHVFARSLATALPIEGVKLTLFSVGQDALATAITDAGGHAAFPAGLTKGRGALRAQTITATHDSDFATASLDSPAFDLSDRGVSGRVQSGPVQAYLTTERGIYRPGETVDVVTLLRDRLGAGFDAPLTLILRRPDGVQARRADLPSGSADGFTHAFALTATAARGQWTIEARVDPSGPPVGLVAFAVQDFVPQQLAVTLSGVPARVTPGQKLAFTVDGRFLYGAPAAGLHGEADLRVLRDDAPVADAPAGYRFGIADETVNAAEQKLAMPDADAVGHASASVAFDSPATVSVPLKAVLSAGLFEPTGRLVADTATLHLRNQAMLIGVRARVAPTTDFFGGQTQAAFDVLTWDADGHPVAAPGLRWSIVRENRVFDWFRLGGDWSFHYHTVDEPVASGALASEAGRVAGVTRGLDWGHYRFVATDGATNVSSSAEFDIGWAEASTDADTPDKVAVTARDTRLAVGQSTVLHLESLFAGEAEIVVANDRLLATRDIEVKAGGNDVAVTASAQWGPGAYVMVSLYRGLAAASARPHEPVRAVGLAYIATDERARTLAVSLGAPAVVEPRRTTTIAVHVAGAGAGETAYVTLAAVDEGILQLTRYASPDPAGFLFGKRRLGVEMRDDYGRLLDGSAPAGAVREGGDAGLGGAGLPVTSTKIVSLFSGPVTVDAHGDARIALAVPDFEGQLRLMAVAWTKDAVGAAAAPMIVRDPVFAELDLPRFLAPGDQARVAVALVDNDRPAAHYILDVTGEGPVRLGTDAHQEATLAPGTRRQFGVLLDATGAGIATLVTDLAGPDGFHQRRTWQITVRPAHYPVTLVSTAQQMPGESFRLDPRQLDSFVPGSLTVSVGYSGVAGIDTVGLLQSLYRYPFGCTEQLASAAWPLISFNDPGLLGRLPTDRDVKARVQTAVDTVVDREDPAGRFGLWRAGDGEASPWLDAYAVDFLMHAKEGGFAVPADALDRALGWIGQEVGQTDEDERFASTRNESRAYGWYVLTRAGRPDLGTMRREDDALASTGSSGPTVVAWSGSDDPAGALSLAHLAGALSLMGEHERAHATFREAVANLGATRSGRPVWWDWTYWSYVRDLSELVAIAADSGEDALAQSLVDQFGKLDLTAPSLSTQEAASLLSAAHALNRDEPGRAVTVNGRAVAPLKLPANFAPDPGEVRAGYTLVNSGTKPLWRTFTLDGAPSAALPALASGYTLDRAEMKLDGSPLDVAHLRQNDRFVVVLSGHATDEDDHRTVLVDMLPAGWEIEAPIRRHDQAPFLGALSDTRVAEARDDRYVAAFDLGEGLRGAQSREVDDDKSVDSLHADEFRVAYIVRVVTPGHFTRPEAVVSDMYRPRLMARTDAGETVADPR